MANVSVCDIDAEVKEKLKKFKFRKEKDIAAIVLKVDSDKQMIVLDEEYEDTSIEEVVGELSDSQPRYVMISYVHKHSDGRESYPFMFVFVSPSGCKPEMHMMYAGSKLELQNVAKVTKVFEVRDKEDLTEEFIQEKLKLFN